MSAAPPGLFESLPDCAESNVAWELGSTAHKMSGDYSTVLCYRFCTPVNWLRWGRLGINSLFSHEIFMSSCVTYLCPFSLQYTIVCSVKSLLSFPCLCISNYINLQLCYCSVMAALVYCFGRELSLL